MVQYSRARSDFICAFVEHRSSLLQNIQRRKLSDLVLFKRVLQREAVQSTRRYQTPVIFRDFDLHAFAVKLAAPRAIGQGHQNKVVGIRFGKGHDVDPAYGACKWLRRVGLNRPIEEALDSFEDARTGKLCAEVCGEALVSVEDACAAC